jgi:two-component system NtrC family response regulator
MNVLIVEDSQSLATRLAGAFEQAGNDVRQAATLKSAEHELATFWPDAVILDANFPADIGHADFNAPAVLNLLERAGEKPPFVILMSGDDRTAKHFNRIGDWLRTGRIADVLSKNVEGGWEFFKELLLHRVDLLRVKRPDFGTGDREESRKWLGANGIISEDESMLRIAASIRKIVANTDNTFSMLITGANGTGKGLIAAAIHREMSRKSSHLPFVRVHCGTIGDGTAVSELLGSMRGAFTGATRDYPGPLEQAGEGVVFLDDIHHLSKAALAALLSPLQDRVFRRMQGNVEIPFRARVISSTNVDLAQLCNEGVLSEEFYNRIARTTLCIPALAQRPGDIELIARSLAAAAVDPPVLRLDVLRAFQAYSWPGNVRQLESVITQMRAFCAGEAVTLKRLRSLDIAYLGQKIEWDAAPGLSGEWDTLLRLFGWDRGWGALGPGDYDLVASWLGRICRDGAPINALEDSLKRRKSPSPKPIHFIKALLFVCLSETGQISHKALEEVLSLGWDFTNRVACYLSGIGNDGASGLIEPFLLRENKNGKYEYSVVHGLLKNNRERSSIRSVG